MTGLILDAMENVANPAKYPEFKGNVAAVYTHPLEHTPGSSGGHYGDDAYTYMVSTPVNCPALGY